MQIDKQELLNELGSMKENINFVSQLEDSERDQYYIGFEQGFSDAIMLIEQF